MYRIVAVTACAAVLAGITFAPASAVTCDERIAGSCPIEPVVEQAEANADAAAVRPLAYARAAGKERGVRRARRASRTLSPGERRRTATVVARALAREREPSQTARRRQQVQVEPQQSLEAPGAPLANAAPPAAATILSPNFVQTIDLRRPRLDTSSLVVADASAQVAAAQAQTTAVSEPAASVETSGQAAPEPPPLAGAAGTTGRRPATERARPGGCRRATRSGRCALAALRLPRVRRSARFGLGDPAVRVKIVGRSPHGAKRNAGFPNCAEPCPRMARSADPRAHPGYVDRASVLGALDVGAVRGHDDDARAGRDVRRHHGAHAVRQHRRLVGRGRGLPLHGRLGLHHLKHGTLRQLDGERHALVQAQLHFHLRLRDTRPDRRRCRPTP